MSQSLVRYISRRSFVEGGRVYSRTYGECVLVGFNADGWATVAPTAGACPFGDVKLGELSAIGGES